MIAFYAVLVQSGLDNGPLLASANTFLKDVAAGTTAELKEVKLADQGKSVVTFKAYNREIDIGRYTHKVRSYRLSARAHLSKGVSSKPEILREIADRFRLWAVVPPTWVVRVVSFPRASIYDDHSPTIVFEWQDPTQEDFIGVRNTFRIILDAMDGTLLSLVHIDKVSPNKIPHRLRPSDAANYAKYNLLPGFSMNHAKEPIAQWMVPFSQLTQKGLDQELTAIPIWRCGEFYVRDRDGKVVTDPLDLN